MVEWCNGTAVRQRKGVRALWSSGTAVQRQEVEIETFDEKVFTLHTKLVHETFCFDRYHNDCYNN